MLLEIRFGKLGMIWDVLLFICNIIFMVFWEYKVIISGLYGFVLLVLLEMYFNIFGKDEWEIIYF